MGSPVSPDAPSEATSPGETGGESFSEQAGRAGLVLPQPKRLNPTLAVLMVVAIVVTSVGVGWATGWINPYGAAQTSNGCAGAKAHLTGGVSSDSTPLPGVLAAMGSEFANTTTGCAAVTVSYIDNPENAGLAPLAAGQVEFLVVPNLPSPTELASLPGPTLVAPVALSGIGVAYHLPGLTIPLNLSAAALSGIYRGTVTKWNDPLIAQFNPGVVLPSEPAIHAFFRSDATGLNAPFTSFLAESNATWSATVGTGTSVQWPSGTGLDASGAMLANLSLTPGSIGYVEAGTPLPAGLEYAQLENPAGTFLSPAANSISTGVESALYAWANLTSLAAGSWGNVSTINAPGSGSYPIPIFSYLVVYGDLGHAYGSVLSGFSARILSILLWWMVSTGQTIAASHGFTPLPALVVALSEHSLNELTYNGTPMYAIANPEGGEGAANETGEF
jgi:phosphate transport system substrate-binding protein